MPSFKKLISNIQEATEALGWSIRYAFHKQTDVADKLEIDHANLSRWTAGKKIPSLSRWLDVLKMCGMTLELKTVTDGLTGSVDEAPISTRMWASEVHRRCYSLNWVARSLFLYRDPPVTSVAGKAAYRRTAIQYVEPPPDTIDFDTAWCLPEKYETLSAWCKAVRSVEAWLEKVEPISPGLWQVIHEKAIWEATLADLTDTSTRGTTSFVFGDDAKVQEASKVLGLPLIHLTSDKIRESQRKKASENHPDKATDEKERTRRTERMKEINNAATTLLQYLNQKKKAYTDNT